jgi:hypothetical protein
MPPLTERLWRGIVVSLLEDDQAVAPEVEALNLSVLPLGRPAEGQAGVDDGVLGVAVRCSQALEPLPSWAAGPLLVAELGLGE